MTYSIIARDSDSGLMGAAVQSHFLAVGAHVIEAEPGTGVMVAQSFADRRYLEAGMKGMASQGAPEALESLMSAHPRGQRRAQLALMPASGPPVNHTGEFCVGFAGHETTDHFAAQANMVASPHLCTAMIDRFRETEGDFVHRLVAALSAAQAEGGDWRGQQSAAIRVVPISATESRTPVIDLRVDDHPAPISELTRLNNLREAALLMEKGIDLASTGDVDGAIELLERAQKTYGPQNQEPHFWAAVVEARDGRYDSAEARLKRLDGPGKGWAELLHRLPDAHLLDIDPTALAQLTTSLRH